MVAYSVQWENGDTISVDELLSAAVGAAFTAGLTRGRTVGLNEAGERVAQVMRRVAVEGLGRAVEHEQRLRGSVDSPRSVR